MPFEGELNRVPNIPKKPDADELFKGMHEKIATNQNKILLAQITTIEEQMAALRKNPPDNAIQILKELDTYEEQISKLREIVQENLKPNNPERADTKEGPAA